MTKRDKLIARIRARPSEASFDDVSTLLKMCGYVDAGGTKHHKFQHPDPARRTVIVPTVRGRTVKRTYLNQICEILGLDDLP